MQFKSTQTFRIKENIEGLKDLRERNTYEDLSYMTPKLIIVFGYFNLWAYNHNLPVEVTNIRHKFSVSRSDSHPSGRAVDISTRGWSKDEIEACEAYMEKVAGHLGAFSASTGKRNVAVYHDAGLGAHFHLQVARGE